MLFDGDDLTWFEMTTKVQTDCDYWLPQRGVVAVVATRFRSSAGDWTHARVRSR